MLDIIFVVEAIRREEPRFVEFRSNPEHPHNLECVGWLELKELSELRTQMIMVFEGGPHFQSVMVNNLANWWVATFDEPAKILKLTFEVFKDHLERQFAAGVSATQESTSKAVQPG